MPQRRGWKTIQIRENIRVRLEKLYNNDTKRPENMSFSLYFENIISDIVEYYEDLQNYGPFIEFLDANDNKIELRDYLKDKIITVYLDPKSKKLQCSYDKNSDCVHVGYCFGIPKIYKTLIQHGFKPKK